MHVAGFGNGQRSEDVQQGQVLEQQTVCGQQYLVYSVLSRLTEV